MIERNQSEQLVLRIDRAVGDGIPIEEACRYEGVSVQEHRKLLVEFGIVQPKPLAPATTRPKKTSNKHSLLCRPFDFSRRTKTSIYSKSTRQFKSSASLAIRTNEETSITPNQ